MFRHQLHEPLVAFTKLAAERGARILTPKLGAAFEPEHVEGPSPWWRDVGVPAHERRSILAPG